MDQRWKDTLDQIVNDVQAQDTKSLGFIKAGADAAAEANAQPADQSGGVLSSIGDIASQGIEKLGHLVRGEADPSFVQAVQQAEGDLSTQQPPQEPGIHEKSVAALAAVPVGAVKAGYEVRDALLGEQADAQKSPLRNQVDAISGDIRGATAVAGAVEGIAQFATGLIGAGKLLSPLKAVSKVEEGGKVIKTAYEAAKGALSGFFAMDPHEERLSNLIQSFPALQNPVNEYLAAKPDDGNAEGRFKNALEGMGLDVAVAAVFGTALKAINFARRGDTEAAKEVVKGMSDPKAVEAVKEIEKPRVRVKAGSQVLPPLDPPVDVPPAPVVAGDKPRVRVKAGSEVTPEVTTAKTDGMPEVQGAVPAEGTSAADSVAKALPAADSTKTVKPLEVSEPDMASILKGTEWDLAAMEQAGSMDEAIAQGYKPASSGSLPWQKLSTPEEANVLINNAAQTLKPELDALKGGDVLSDEKLNSQVRKMAKYFNLDPSAVLGEIAKSGEAAIQSVRSMEAGYLVSSKMFMDTYELVNKIRWGDLADFGGDRAAAITEAKRRLGLAVQTFGSAQSVSSNAGRSLRRMRGQFKVTPKDLKALDGLDGERFLQAVADAGGDPSKLRDLAKPGALKILLDEVSYSMRNGLLWLYPTHLVNMTGNVYMQVARPLEKTIGSLLLGHSAVTKQAQKEYYYALAATFDGLKAGAEAFLKGDSLLAPHTIDLMDGGSLRTAHPQIGMPNFKPFDSIENLWHNLHLGSIYRNASGLPTRALGAQDEFFKTLRYRAVVQARAAVEGEAAGLSKADIKSLVETRLAQAFDENGLAIDREALHEAQTATFNQELIKGTLGATIRNARSAHPGLGLVLPFVKTPVNVLRYAHKYTPGLNLIQKEFRTDLLGANGVERQSQAMGQMAMGTMFTMASLFMASEGMLTGGGPADGKQRQQLLATGWKPYSIRIEKPDGSVTYFPYGRFDPSGLTMSIAADIWDMYQVHPNSKDVSNAGTALALALAKNFSEKTFLLNFNQMIDALADPENKAEKFFGNMASSAIPASSALRGYANEDPYLREARGLVDRTLKDMPGYSEKLPPKRTVFGDPVPRVVGLTSNSKWDAVDQENNRMILETGQGIGPPNPVHSGIDLRDITLHDGKNAFDLLQEYAADPGYGMPKLRESISALISTKEYQNMADGDAGVRGTRLNAMSGVVQDYRAAAMRRLAAEYPEVTQEMNRAQAQAAADYLDKSSGAGAGQALLKKLGY